MFLQRVEKCLLFHYTDTKPDPLNLVIGICCKFSEAALHHSDDFFFFVISDDIGHVFGKYAMQYFVEQLSVIGSRMDIVIHAYFFGERVTISERIFCKALLRYLVIALADFDFLGQSPSASSKKDTRLAGTSNGPL